ncbi:MAG: hypothetical protein KTR31_23790 [Myxococcales bacterium]|nr:hypothetical protein [Myxococcales bacterium]
MTDDRFRLQGQLVASGQPVSAWLEVQDEDVVMHDFLAAGRSQSDGRFTVEFTRRAFNQQPWENEDQPDLVVFVWRDAPPDTAPRGEDPPSHCIRLPQAVFREGVADVGPIELEAAPPGGLGWLLRQVNTSRRPGGDWTLGEVERLSEQVRGWVNHECRTVPPSGVEVQLEPLDDAVGTYRPATRSIVLDPTFIAQLGPDALRRLLAHEWAHATAHHALQSTEEVHGLARNVALLHWARDIAEHVPLETDDVALCVSKQAMTANHEGFAHFVEERVVRRRLPLSAYPVESLWDRAKFEATERRLDETTFRTWLAQHDQFALRYLGLAWYRHQYRSGRGRARYHPEAAADLLDACRDRFSRLVRGEGRAKLAPRTEPWS